MPWGQLGSLGPASSRFCLLSLGVPPPPASSSFSWALGTSLTWAGGQLAAAQHWVRGPLCLWGEPPLGPVPGLLQRTRYLFSITPHPLGRGPPSFSGLLPRPLLVLVLREESLLILVREQT